MNILPLSLRNKGRGEVGVHTHSFVRSFVPCFYLFIWRIADLFFSFWLLYCLLQATDDGFFGAGKDITIILRFCGRIIKEGELSFPGKI